MRTTHRSLHHQGRPINRYGTRGTDPPPLQQHRPLRFPPHISRYQLPVHRSFHTNTTLMEEKHYENPDTTALRIEWSRLSRGSSRLPSKLEHIVEDLVASVPKRTLRQTAKTLSDTLRVRLRHPTSSTTPEKPVNNKGEEEKKEEEDKKGSVDASEEHLLPDGSPPPRSRREQRRRLAQEASERREEEMQRLGMGRQLRRQKRRDDIRVIYGRDQAVAYAAHRMPAIYGAVHRVLKEVSRRLPGYNPTSQMDFGSGTGTSVWAASETFPSLEHVVCVEPSSGMMDVGMEVLEHAPPHVAWRRFLHDNTTRRHELVSATYVLNELQEEEEMIQTVRRLWSVTSGVLVLLEPGTPAGFANILAARSALLATTPRPVILGPCPHAGTCPMAEHQPSDQQWCHFAQRVERTAFQRTAKTNTTLGYEDEKFSYLTLCREDMLDNWQRVPEEHNTDAGIMDGRLAREAAAERWGRVVSPPRRRGKHVHLELCNGDGELEHRVVTKKKAEEPGEYKAARKVFWGDVYAYSRSGDSNV